MASGIRVSEADLKDPEQQRALVELIDSYARGPGGQMAPLPAEVRERIGPGLRDHPTTLVLLARVEDAFVGAAVCFWGFSTFAGKPYLNVHDLVAHPDHQGRGIGTALLEEAQRRATAKGCCKLTLEVLDSNVGAKRLYERFGFAFDSLATFYVTKRL